MTPKEKALELMNKFNNYHNTELKEYIIYQSLEESKRCALIAIDEILNLNFNVKCDASEKCVNSVMNYWEEVKEELIKL